MVTCMAEKKHERAKKHTVRIAMACEREKTKTRDGVLTEMQDSVGHGSFNIFPPTQAGGGMEKTWGSTVCMSYKHVVFVLYVCLIYVLLFAYLYIYKAFQRRSWTKN